jgi:hypothetical protein
MALHLRRPSQLCELRLKSTIEDISIYDALSSDLNILSCLHNIAQGFTAFPSQSEKYFESLVPLPLQVSSRCSDITLPSATLYTALHPLFTTTSDACSNSRVLSDTSSRLFHVIARSATIVIGHFDNLNQSNSIISIWMAAERVLEAGVIWASFLMSQRHTAPTEEHHFLGMETHIAMRPILKVSTLLASFAARWKDGLAYTNAWETLIELLWNIV